MRQSKTRPISPDLERWDNICEDWKISGLLIGNGASCNVWDGFAYHSLYEIACTENQEHRLDETDQALFDQLDTRNFERVLGGLTTSQRVNTACGIPCSELSDRHQSIQVALIEAVKTHHVTWAVVEAKIRHEIREALLQYSFVYSTNYDLLVYWGVMADGGTGFKDYFWTESFDLGNVEIWDKTTRVLYLHGGLHLCRSEIGATLKRGARPGSNLLDEFGKRLNGEEVTPLFIAEGTSKDKLTSIYRSDYLSFAYSRLANHTGDLCIFGQSLGDEDRHIVQAIEGSMVQRAAISLRPAQEREIVAKKAAYFKNFPALELRFFDSTSHPLGSATLGANGQAA